MPIFSSTAASSTEPAVGAVVWAGGSQVCTGKTGTLTAEPGDEEHGHEQLGPGRQGGTRTGGEAGAGRRCRPT